MKKIDWSYVWAEFDAWCKRIEKSDTCDECGHMGESPEWEDQQKRIQALVEKEVRRYFEREGK